MKLLGYIRRSQDTGTGVSEEIQRSKITQWAALYDHEVKFLPPDLDESSWTLDRPGLQAALKQLAAGKAEGIVAATQDRLTRRTRDFCDLLEIAEREHWHVFAVDTGLDTTKDSTLHKVLAVFAEREYRDKRDRYDDARANAVLEHGVHGGTNPPHGYRFTFRGQDRRGNALRGPLEPSADAPRILEAFKAFDAGASWKEVTQVLGANGQGAAHAMLTNRAYLGEARSGRFVKEGAHVALVEAAVFNRVQRKLARGRRSVSYRGATGALLGAGILRCSHCGYALVRDSGASGARYKCREISCRRSSIQAAAVEPIVLAHALTWHATLNSMYGSEVDEELMGLEEKKLADAQAQVEAIEVAFADAELTPIAYGRALSAAQRAVATAETVLAEVEASGGWLGMNTEAVQRRLFTDTTGSLPDPAKVKDVQAAREFVREMVRVVVHPVGRGKRVPAQERIEVKLLTPAVALRRRGAVADASVAA